MSAQKFPITVTIKDLKLADVVELFEGPFGTGVVQNIDADEVVIVRPYGVTGDFSYTGGVPYSVGNEECVYPLVNSNRTTFKVWQRKELR